MIEEEYKKYFGTILDKYKIKVEHMYFLDKMYSYSDTYVFSIIVNFNILDKENYKNFMDYIYKLYDVRVSKLSNDMLLISIRYKNIKGDKKDE